MSTDDIIQIRFEGRVAIMTMNYPARRNAFNLKMRTTMYERLLELEADDQCGAIVLTGAGGYFCSGGDISEMEQRPVVTGRNRFDLVTRIFKQFVSGPKPFLVAVEGVAAGCGLSFVSASDYAVAATDTKFSCAFINVGLMPDSGGIWSLPRKIGYRKAMEMAALGDTYDAQAALDMQLINKVCEPGKALEETIAIAQRFASKPPLAMALLRAALHLGNESVDQAINTEIDYMPVLQNTGDYAEAARAFIEKRKPNFTGN
ncbi:MAG: enoyl-CoA hydratase/isomerase family protein [Azonexus sp.]|jgi:enoyl-CoA hydratase/carnithine racemase|nr:enoyl-CoA hydratase/isomerase family protein [Azonexus sp.]